MTNISYQGIPGSYSEGVAKKLFPSGKLIGCLTFYEAFLSTQNRTTEYSVIPVENLIAGRVADVHYLLPESGLFITKEHFEPIEHQLLALPGAELSDIKFVTSHVQALSQCQKFINQSNLISEVCADTALAAEVVSLKKNKNWAAIASARAAEIYGLKILKSNISDIPGNKTRFLVLARNKIICDTDKKCLTTLVFTVKSVPSALYNVLGVFAEKKFNLTKIESYLSVLNFNSTTFYVDIEVNSTDEKFQKAMSQLNKFAENIKILGTYEQDLFRR